MVTRNITNPKEILDVAKFKENSNAEILCSVDKTAVQIKSIANSNSPQIFGASSPRYYVFESCCEEAIDNALNVIKEFSAKTN